LNTRFRYSQDPFGDILVSLRESGSFPTGGTAVSSHYVPMDISTGFAYDFDFGTSKRVTDLVLCWSVEDIATMVAEELPVSSVLHAGAELELFGKWQLRAGFNQGYLTFGTGIQFWVLDLNLAFFARETGSLSTNRANAGMTFELAFRREGKRERKRDRRREDDGAAEDTDNEPADQQPAEEASTDVE